MSRVRYHEMVPRELVARRSRCPVGFVGIGTLEWHGWHAATGLDGLKAERLAELAAEASGGFAFPTLWYGEPRSIEHMDSAHGDTPAIRRALGLPPLEELPPSDPDGEVDRFQTLVRQLVLELRFGAGMEVVCLIAGHYPMRAWLEPVVARLAPVVPVVLGSDADFLDPRDDEVAGADHAGVWETSYLWHLRPDCVDLTINDGPDDERLIGVLGRDPRDGASRERGSVAVERIVEGIVARARAALAQSK